MRTTPTIAFSVNSSRTFVGSSTIYPQLQISDQHEDILMYGTACSDNIPDLECFKNICTPIFLFLAAG